MADVQQQLGGLKERWNKCRAEDDQKKKLIDLLDAESDLQDKKILLSIERETTREREKEVQGLKNERARLDFACVVLDGDCMPFKDELVKEGLEGGKKTANLLRNAVQKELTSSLGVSHHLQIHVRVYTNIKGQAKTYKEMGIIPEATDKLPDFIRGFNMGDPLFDFVDAGNGKECADVKVKAYFEFCFANIHCRQIIFGGSADNGYARLLGPLAQDDAMCKRVTLLEGPPFAGELIAIKNNFRTVKFEDIFRSEKLENRMTYHYSHPVIPVPFNYASAAARPPFPPEPSSAGQRGSSPPTTSVWRGRVFRNKNGERIDQPLEYSRLDYEKVKPLRLCNNFYLLGTCTWGDKCEHDHKMRLSDGEKAALRALARQRPCQSGL
ncbi:hypothetical protein P885DRAFT_8808, partial [Corynascus similis CBS 632.67]